MKNRFLLGMMALLALVFTACSSDDDIPNQSGAKGRLSVNLNIDSSLRSSRGSSRAEYNEVTVDDLTLHLVSDDGQVDMTFTPAEITAAPKEVRVGDYTLEAYYGSTEQDGFEMPYFYGSQRLTVTENNLTEVNLTASLCNSMVSIKYTDAFKLYFSRYSASVLSSASRTTVFAADETRPAYIATGDCKIFVDVTKTTSTSATFQPASFTAEAATLYEVTLDVNNGAVGQAVLVITFDDNIGQEPIEIELSDELMNAPAPTIKFDNYTVNSAGEIELSVVEGCNLANALSAQIMARGGLAEVPLVTVSSDLVTRGWPAEIDLMAATSAQQSTLTNLGMSVMGLWHNPEKMAVVDFTGVFPNMQYVEGASNVNRFTIYAKDKYTKVCDPVTVVVTVKKMELVVSNATSKEESGIINAELYFPGANMSDVTMQVYNKRGTYTDAAYTYATINASRSEAANYTVSITIPSDASDDKHLVRAVYTVGSKTVYSEAVEYTIVPFEFALSAADNNVFGWKVTLDVTSNVSSVTDAQAASLATVYVRASGATTWTKAQQSVSGTQITVTGLTAGTAYEFMGYLNDNKDRDCKPYGATTEEPLQLPNAGMEDWDSADSGVYWTMYYPYSSWQSSPWGTNNPMTCSQGAGLAYTHATGTRPSTDAHGGTNAAWIRTQGWGSGNTAPGTGIFASAAVMKYADPGLLHLGASRSDRPSGYTDREGPVDTDDLSCGYAFTSRPSALSFWYKYTPKQSADAGQVYVWIKDASGNVLYTTSKSLSSASAYTQVNIPFTYAAGAAKAAQIYVRFLSTSNRDYLSKSTSNFDYPGFGDPEGEYLGSQLYIDDITLSY